MARYSHPSYPGVLVNYQHKVTCPKCGFPHAESEMFIVEWLAFCIRDEGGCGCVWSLENGQFYLSGQDGSQ